MILIGLLHHLENPEKVTKSYAYAAVAKAEGAELLYFCPSGVIFEKKCIKGYQYRAGNWVESICPFPDIIYNTSSAKKNTQWREIIQKLKKQIPFTSYPIGNKMQVYQTLKKNSEFAEYLIASIKVDSVKQFLDYFEVNKKVVLKPVRGHKGEGIIFIESINNQYHLLTNTTSFDFNYKEFLQFISYKLQEKRYLVQPYINCKTKSGTPYDLRLHVQKNGEGKWVNTTIYYRIAPKRSIICNISNGGLTGNLKPFLKQEFGDEYFNIKRTLEYLAIQLAKYLDKVRYETFSQTLDELGIDVGLDHSQRIWLYEVNWRPGCPPAFYLELDVVRNTIRYAIFLAKMTKHNSNKGFNL
ncbi:YheC/YheD family protein [Clostridium pasteurianum]|uniref:ATP-grasp domain-containing protein n=1 Tax=Clostridium pasteurianum BC1 TaxID=86416 RepID=R4K333_CLOPA|nr:YheC/YheD family protein [Clostridium pasteurianum]AGK97502.1 hypothetical protein Clopa_2647 [Clostridium pasteurianum BC1]